MKSWNNCQFNISVRNDRQRGLLEGAPNEIAQIPLASSVQWIPANTRMELLEKYMPFALGLAEDGYGQIVAV